MEFNFDIAEILNDTRIYNIILNTSYFIACITMISGPAVHDASIHVLYHFVLEVFTKSQLGAVI